MGTCQAAEVEQDEVVVLEGRHGDLSWQIKVSGDEPDFLTMLHVYQGKRLLAASGMSGPKLYPGEVINEWRGRADDLPYFVMVRADPVVERVVEVTERGAEFELAMSPVIAACGLRFAAAGLPEGDAPCRLRVTTDGGALVEVNTPIF